MVPRPICAWITIAILAFVFQGCAFYRPQPVSFDMPASRLPQWDYCMATQGGVCARAVKLFDVEAPPHALTPLPIAETAKPTAWLRDDTKNRRGRGFEKLDAPPDEVRTFLAAVEGERVKRNEDFNRFVTHPLTNTMLQARQAAKGRSDNPVVNFSLSASEMSNYSTLVTSLSLTDGWAIVAQDANPATREGQERAIYATYLSVYMKAYFRNGRFAEVKFDLADFYKRNPELEKYKNQLDPILKSVADYRPFGKIGDSAFVSRVGRQLQFSPVEITIDPTKHTAVSISKVDFGEVAADLVRLTLEALFDARDRLPGLGNASGVDKDAFKEHPTDILQVFTAHETPGQGELSSEQFTHTATYANSVEGAAGSVTAQAIRGLNIAALNNEALAKALEAVVGTWARKVTEKATYCWYACVVNGTATKSVAGTDSAISSTLPRDSSTRVTLQFVP